MPVQAPPPVPPSPAAQQFVQAMSKISAQFGVSAVALLFVDPVTRTSRMVSSPGAIPQLRRIAAEKFDLGLPEDVAETSWE